ncbi:uncharacterized protein LOC113349803 [Papaver somniferum]|uniref:uncharacterized protein LOC113349803 n=1 Tax=Papaver somniferum TaxID=3469 RepID=UPI000E704415|nr:uncharacterized protein LOC113349803 [Papaver somniferum]
MLYYAINRWQPPLIEKIKINLDVTVGSKGCGCAAVARDSNSDYQGGKSKELEFNSPSEAEANGALIVIGLAISKGFRNIILEGDSLTVINSLRYKNSDPPWRIRNKINNIGDKISSFNSVEFSIVKKDANVLA